MAQQDMYAHRCIRAAG